MQETKQTERTFVMLKPDALEQGLVGEVVARLESQNLRATRFLWRVLSEELATKHYAHLVGEPYFPELLQYITRGPVLTSIWEAPNAVAVVRKLVGATDPAKAEPGTIRRDFGKNCTENLIHASDSPEAAEREIALFF